MNATQWLLVINAAGVVLAGYAIWTQLRLFKRQVHMNVYLAFTDRYRDIVARIPHVFVGEKSKPKLTTEEESALRAYFDLCYEEFILRSEDAIPPFAWPIWERGMRIAFTRPLIQQGWELVGDTSYFDGAFRDFSREINPNSKR